MTATDEDSDPLTYIVVTAPAHGTLSGTGPDLASRRMRVTPDPIPSPSGRLTHISAATWRLCTITVRSGPLTPLPPTGLYTSAINGNTITFRWTPPSGGSTPTGYAIEGGINPGQVLASLPTGPSPAFTVDAATGAFYVRVHTLSGANKSAGLE